MTKKHHTDASANQPSSFDLDYHTIKQLGYQTVDAICSYIQTLSTSPTVKCPHLDECTEMISQPLPQDGSDPQQVLQECTHFILSNAVHLGHPRFLGWIVPSATPIGAFADGLASAMNQNVSISGSGAATAIELCVLNWIKTLIGYPRTAGGLLVSGGSVGNLTALTIARNVQGKNTCRQKGMNQHTHPLKIYMTNQAHSCLPRAVDVLGIGLDNIRWIDVDKNYQMDVADLELKITEDIQLNDQPLAVVASAGTTNTGSIDPLDAIAEVCRTHNLWFHVDAAYGGFATLSPSHKSVFVGLEKADSVVLDPHKWLYIPYEAGCVLVKNPEHMTSTFQYPAEYIHLDEESSTDINFSERGLQLSRGFRALKIWMSLKQYGVKQYASMIEQNIALAQYCANQITAMDDFSLCVPPSLSIVCFQYVPKDLQQSQDSNVFYLSTLNKAILQKLRRDKRVILSGTYLADRYVLRVCIINFRTQKEDIDLMIDVIGDIGKKEDSRLRSHRT